MSRESTTTGYVKIRQAYNRGGKGYCTVALPTAVMEQLGLEPGLLLLYYVTKDGAVKYKAAGGADFVAGHPDADVSGLPRGQKLIPVKPGSLAERAQEVDDGVQYMIDKMSGLKPTTKPMRPMPDKRPSAEQIAEMRRRGRPGFLRGVKVKVEKPDQDEVKQWHARRAKARATGSRARTRTR